MQNCPPFGGIDSDYHLKVLWVEYATTWFGVLKDDISGLSYEVLLNLF